MSLTASYDDKASLCKNIGMSNLKLLAYVDTFEKQQYRILEAMKHFNNALEFNKKSKKKSSEWITNIEDCHLKTLTNAMEIIQYESRES